MDKTRKNVTTLLNIKFSIVISHDITYSYIHVDIVNDSQIW